MARIYDNIETMFTPGLQGIISNVGVKRVDFCVGYFNLRGWKVIVNEIDNLQGDWIYEKKNGNDERVLRTCRLLIGCLLYTSPSPRDSTSSRMPSSA